jgi:beta-lactam-binding protein with PASTA domain
MPDMTGMSARDAIRRLMKVGINVRLTGDGMVQSQDPPAGTAIEAGMMCHLLLDRSAPRAAPAASPGHP